MSIGKLVATLLPVGTLLPMETLLPLGRMVYRVRLDPSSPFNCHDDFFLSVSLARDDALTPILLSCTLARLSIGSFNKTLAAKPAPVNFSGQKNLFNDGSGSIDINADLKATVGISAVAAGSIIPPKVTQFGITFGM